MAVPPDLGDPADPGGMLALSERFFAALLVDGYSPRTIGAWRYKLRPFMAWCHERGVDRPQDVTRDLLERFKAWQHAWRDEDGKGLAVLSQVGRLIVIRAFFKWLAKNNVLLFNPASEVDYPKVGFRLPKVVFTPSEVEQVLAQPDLETPLGLRDRAILETFYSTGLRRMEVANLDLTDLDEGRGTLLVRQGKGAKDRVVPIGERAIAWVTKYLADGRPLLLPEPTCPALFVSKTGARLTGSAFTKMANRYMRAAEGQRKSSRAGSCSRPRSSRRRRRSRTPPRPCGRRPASSSTSSPSCPRARWRGPVGFGCRCRSRFRLPRVPSRPPPTAGRARLRWPPLRTSVHPAPRRRRSGSSG